MNITAEQFKQIVADARGQESDRRNEKRDAVRIGVHYIATVRPTAPGRRAKASTFSGAIRDISAKGVGLVCPVPVIGRFTLEMTDAQGLLHAVNCSATSCRSITKDQFQVGAVFGE